MSTTAWVAASKSAGSNIGLGCGEQVVSSNIDYMFNERTWVQSSFGQRVKLEAGKLLISKRMKNRGCQ